MIIIGLILAYEEREQDKQTANHTGKSNQDDKV
jgi:hypothetical protein